MCEVPASRRSQSEGKEKEACDVETKVEMLVRGEKGTLLMMGGEQTV